MTTPREWRCHCPGEHGRMKAEATQCPRCGTPRPSPLFAVGDRVRVSDRQTLREAFDLLYHVPGSQAHGGSRGGQTGRIHLHVKPGEAFEAGRIRRVERQSLCGRRGWYERTPEDGEQACERCVEIGSRSNGRISGLETA